MATPNGSSALSKKEGVDLSDQADYRHAHQRLGGFLDELRTHKCILSSLGHLAPPEFESQWLTEQALRVTGTRNEFR